MSEQRDQTRPNSDQADRSQLIDYEPQREMAPPPDLDYATRAARLLVAHVALSLAALACMAMGSLTGNAIATIVFRVGTVVLGGVALIGWPIAFLITVGAIIDYLNAPKSPRVWRCLGACALEIALGAIALLWIFRGLQ